MPDTSSQPLVTVRKADGSVVRMTLGELEALKKKTAPPVQVTPLASDNRAGDVESVMKDIGTLVGKDVQNRLRSVVQLYLKDVRSLDETTGALERPTSEGGLGLSDQNVRSVIAKIQALKASSIPVVPAFTIKDKKTDVPDLDLPETVPARFDKNREPQVVPQNTFPTVASPYNSFKHEAPRLPKKNSTPVAAVPTPQAVKPVSKPLKQVAPSLDQKSSQKSDQVFSDLLRAAAETQPLEIKDLIGAKKEPPTFASKPIQPERPLQLSHTPEPRPLVRDVHPVSLEVGPIDEIGRLTLVDFRRLGATTAESIAHLKDKFTNLKAESILLYLEAMDAWQRSPLYLEYIASLVRSLAEHRPLSAVLTDKQHIQPLEIMALIEMENDLS